MNVFLFHHVYRIPGTIPRSIYEEFVLKERELFSILLTEVSENLKTESDNILFEDGSYLLQEDFTGLATE